MDRNKELVKNTITLAVGKFCTQFISFLLLPLYTYCLATEDYGYIDLIQTYLTFFIPIIILKLDVGVFRFLIDDREDEEGKSKTLTSAFVMVLLQIILSIIVYIILINFINLKYNILIVANIITLSLVTFFLQAIRGLGNNKEYSISSILSATVTVICNVIFLIIFHKNGEFVLLSSLIANICCLSFLLFSNSLIKYINIKKFNKKTAKELIKYSLPMIPSELSHWIINLSDRTIISIFIGFSASAIYSVGYKLSNILSSLYAIFGMSWQESASVHINDEDKNVFFNNVINKTFTLFVSACVLIINCMPILFNIIIGKEYIDSYNYIPILLLGNIFSVLFNLIGNIYTAKKLSKEIAKTTVFAAVINIVINLLFIKIIGVYAAAISTLIAFMVLAIYRFFDIQKYVKIKLKINNIFINLIFIIISVIIYYLNNIYISIIGIIPITIYVLLINKTLLNAGVKMIKNKFKK